MNFNIPLLIASLIYIILICFLYFSKNIQNNVENKIYKYLLIISLLGIILDISGIYAHMLLSETNIIRYLIVKFYMQYLLTFAYLITIYIIYVGKNSEKNKIIIKGSSYFIYLTVYLILSFFNFILPFEYYNSGNIVYIYGLNCTYLYAIVGINMIFWIIYVFKKRKQISKKKVLPIISFIVLSVPVILLQLYNPEFLLVTSLSAFVVVFMYHTIENPDVKMLEEFRIAKDRAEKANEEKELFLYNITQDIREPLKEITKASNWLNENTRNKNVTDATYYINKNASNVIDLVNNVLDISTLEITNIKVYNTSYNINNIVKFIEKTYKEKVSEKVEFRIKIDSNIPTTLYGDQIRLKQAIQILLDNSIKYTKNGFIDFNINCIEKNKLCRLLVTIEDSGEGIKPSEMEEILNKDTHLIKNDKIDDSKSTIAMAKSIVNLLGGTLLIDSELGSGTKMTIVLDQKIYDEKSLELNKIEKDVSKFIDNTKVMVVVENEEYREKVVKKLSRYDIELEVVELGSKCLDNIRMSKKYDLIIMDESLSHLSSIEIITKLKEIPSFNTPVALLTDNIDNKGYINNGFTYLLDKKIPSKELESIIEKIEK